MRNGAAVPVPALPRDGLGTRLRQGRGGTRANLANPLGGNKIMAYSIGRLRSALVDLFIS